MRDKERTAQELLTKLENLERQRQIALDQHEDYITRLHSQNDPAWVELVLKRELGVVPEGQVKVYFKPKI